MKIWTPKTPYVRPLFYVTRFEAENGLSNAGAIAVTVAKCTEAPAGLEEGQPGLGDMFLIVYAPNGQFRHLKLYGTGADFVDARAYRNLCKQLAKLNSSQP